MIILEFQYVPFRDLVAHRPELRLHRPVGEDEEDMQEGRQILWREGTEEAVV